MPRVQIVPPGTDPLQRPVNNSRPELPWKWIIALAVVLLVTFGPILAVKAMKPKPDDGPAATQTRQAAGDFTRTPTPGGSPGATLVASPTPTETPILMGAFAQLTGVPQLATPGENGEVSCNGSTTTIRVEVTRVVQAPAPACTGGGSTTTINTEVTRVVTQIATRQVTQIATQLVTAVVTELVPGASPTPGPTSTPWVILVELTRPVEVTRVVEVTRIVEVTSTPTATATATPTQELPTPAPTETLAAYPYP